MRAYDALLDVHPQPQRSELWGKSPSSSGEYGADRQEFAGERVREALFTYSLKITESRVNEETSLERSRSVQDLMTEATNDLFQKLGKARIADLNGRGAP